MIWQAIEISFDNRWTNKQLQVFLVEFSCGNRRRISEESDSLNDSLQPLVGIFTTNHRPVGVHCFKLKIQSRSCTRCHMNFTVYCKLHFRSNNKTSHCPVTNRKCVLTFKCRWNSVNRCVSPIKGIPSWFTVKSTKERQRKNIFIMQIRLRQ
jgi:hypothetical protein